MMLDPCGMIMGYIRTAYKTQVVFSPGAPPVTVRWYRAPRRAKLFPGQHMGLSRLWTNYSPDVGEVPGARRVYDKGENKRHTKGQCFRGKTEWFRDGIDFASLAGQIVVDHCTSCPGFGPVIDYVPKHTEQRQTWWSNHNGSDFLPIVIMLRVQNSVSGTSDGYWQFVRHEPDTEWLGSVGVVPTVADLSVYFLGDIHAGLQVAGGGFPLLNVLGALPWNPYGWTANCQNPYGDFDLSTVFSVESAPVRPVYFAHARAGIAWMRGPQTSGVRLEWAPSSAASDLPRGPSGFDSGYDDGYGGP